MTMYTRRQGLLPHSLSPTWLELVTRQLRDPIPLQLDYRVYQSGSWMERSTNADMQLAYFFASLRIIDMFPPLIRFLSFLCFVSSLPRLESVPHHALLREFSASSCQVIYSQFGLAIHQNHHQARRRFVEWAQNEIAVVPDFHKRILFSDEAHFWLNGYVNKQNCRIWSEANPQVYVETPLHPEKLTGALYGLVESFFKNDEGRNVTVNGDRYRAMITNFFIPELNNHDVQELWFQQDGATCHTARATID
ncbi:putative DD41D transposase [Trichonephila clavipes]|nr:putative DD41D transposase [Trichonephila clavipes]